MTLVQGVLTGVVRVSHEASDSEEVKAPLPRPNRGRGGTEREETPPTLARSSQDCVTSRVWGSRRHLLLKKEAEKS